MTFQLCSSKDTTKQEDCIKVKQSDLSMEFYDDLKTFKKWLKSNNNCNKIIFSTYQSSKILSKVFNKNYKIDFAIFDEAHRTATQSQKIDSYYSYALEDKNIPIEKRLFMTATRRITNYKRKNKHGEPILSISMDRKELYGNVVVDLSFFEAATKHEAIAIPRLIVSEVFSNEVEQERRKISSTHMGGLKIKSDYLALLIAIKKSVEKYNIKKIFSFHSGVPKAKKFTEGILPDSLGYHLKDFYTSHVSGAMSMRKRDIIMEEFKQNPKSVVSNARCLVEGVNVPAVDMVAFIDNKSSEIDIVQAIGRALRKPRGKNASKKKYGYVLLPLFIERKKNESLAKSIERTNFEKVVLMLKALKEHDSEIAKIISEVLVSESRGKGFSEKSKKELGDIFDTNHPEITKKILINSIHANIIEDLRLKFDEMFGYLKAYHDKFSTYDVSFDNIEFRELRRWISYIRLRYRQKELPNFQVDQLDKINFNWKEPNVTTFSKGNLKSTFDLAKKFKLKNQTVIRTLKNIKPLQFYFGSGIMDPIPLYKDYSEKEFAKLMGYDFIDTKDYLTRTQIVSKVKLGIKTVDILIKIKFLNLKELDQVILKKI